MINFDQLPQENPFGLPPVGLYKAYIAEAEMRKPKPSKGKDGNTIQKPDYLNLKYTLTGIDGKGAGSVYDILSESESSVVQYKLARFLRACGIPLVGSMSLVDIAKVVKGKTIVVDLSHDKRSDTPRAQVDLFNHEAYYTADEFVDVYNTIYKGVTADGAINEGLPAIGEENAPFDAADGGVQQPMNRPTAEY